MSVMIISALFIISHGIVYFTTTIMLFEVLNNPADILFWTLLNIILPLVILLIIYYRDSPNYTVLDYLFIETLASGIAMLESNFTIERYKYYNIIQKNWSLINLIISLIIWMFMLSLIIGFKKPTIHG